MPETSGVIESPCKLLGRLSTDVSITPLAPKLVCRPGLSSGRAVLMLIVAPIPPAGVDCAAGLVDLDRR